MNKRSISPLGERRRRSCRLISESVSRAHPPVEGRIEISVYHCVTGNERQKFIYWITFAYQDGYQEI
ncbi:unnamed protein product [Acanthoscelides obtectus]|uniref:Uncharacterized protein n=1 Tax=Acanthoscelides obtectus TaxID=200917 RepID=A0A9P0MI78_ACAOB|nr:unnamed protein product [Acanthoscelides obtectus]